MYLTALRLAGLARFERMAPRQSCLKALVTAPAVSDSGRGQPPEKSA